ncbi:MarR family transcriptional regulator [Nakamurella sp. YIM 132087]|uniref:MarR family transcriptional regulator n=1 Tax=Nakamurella alba TaxID=2665158 RepID=A0A7K1FVC1_9ACTN|nr:MarR family transcriptional regulator [Nakamurella alba]MTD17153.1 MarR family transcriptional regulator [Nakamurella alba]
MADAPVHVEDLTGFLIYRLGMELAQVLAEALGPAGLRPRDLRMLGYLSETAMSQRDLGERAGLDRTTMVAAVDHLEQAGFVQRHRSTTDRRRYDITLTDRGREAHASAMRHLSTVEEDYLRPLTAAQRSGLRGGLEALFAAHTIDC